MALRKAIEDYAQELAVEIEWADVIQLIASINWVTAAVIADKTGHEIPELPTLDILLDHCLPYPSDDVEIGANWGYELHFLSMPFERWVSILFGEKWEEEEPYWYEGKEFTGTWSFNGKGELEVWYDGGGVGWNGGLSGLDLINGPKVDEVDLAWLVLSSMDKPNQKTLSMSNLAATLRKQGDFAGARGLQEQVLEAHRRTLGEDHRDTLEAMNDLARTLQELGELDDARKLQEQVLERCRRNRGESDRETLRAMNDLALTIQYLGDLAGARRLQEHVLEESRRSGGEKDQDTLIAMDNLAVTLREQGDLSGARRLQEQVLEICQRLGIDSLDKPLSSYLETFQRHLDLANARRLQNERKL